MTSPLVTAPTRYAKAGKWTRWGHSDIDPNPTPPPPPPSVYDWTVNPYGTAYDARLPTAPGLQSGGYTPDASQAGVPAGSSYAAVESGSGGYFTLATGQKWSKAATVTASDNTVHLVGHGLTNGHPVYFTSLTGGAGLLTGPLNVYVVTNATDDTFQLRYLKKTLPTDLSFSFGTVNVTANYTAATVVAGIWNDQVDYACHIKASSSAAGVVLFTRTRHRGPATAIDPASSSSSQGLIFTLAANLMVIVADAEFVPTAPVNKLDAFYGKNARLFRPHLAHTIDGVGSQGNIEIHGYFTEKSAWIYPDTVDGHSDGTHNDQDIQIFGGDHHVLRGGHGTGLVDAAASRTSDPTGHPIPTTTNSDVEISPAGSLPIPSGVDIQYCLHGGGGYQVNIAGTKTYPNGGVVANNQHYLHDAALKGKYSNISGICAPAPHATAGVVLHFDIPSTGARANVDENGDPFDPYVDPAGSLVYP